MFEGLADFQVWLLLAAAAAVGFYAGRLSAGASPEAQTRYRRMAEEAATQDFTRLPPTAQTEVDRLAAAGKTIAAVKLVRAALGLDLYEAKQVVDQRKRKTS